jgi:hypothetical protein
MEETKLGNLEASDDTTLIFRMSELSIAVV